MPRALRAGELSRGKSQRGSQRVAGGPRTGGSARPGARGEDGVPATAGTTGRKAGVSATATVLGSTAAPASAHSSQSGVGEPSSRSSGRRSSGGSCCSSAVERPLLPSPQYVAASGLACSVPSHSCARAAHRASNVDVRGRVCGIRCDYRRCGELFGLIKIKRRRPEGRPTGSLTIVGRPSGRQFSYSHTASQCGYSPARRTSPARTGLATM